MTMKGQESPLAYRIDALVEYLERHDAVGVRIGTTNFGYSTHLIVVASCPNCYEGPQAPGWSQCLEIQMTNLPMARKAHAGEFADHAKIGEHMDRQGHISNS
jgi:hypothetical protein